MFAAALMALVLAAPSPAKECKKDVDFALRELDKQCGHFFKTKGISWSKVRKEMLKECKSVKSDQDEFMVLNRLIARLRDGHAYVKVEPAAQDVHQAVDLVPAGDNTAKIAGAVNTENRLVAEALQHPGQFSGNPVHGLIPGDAFKAPFTTAAHTLHGVQEPVFRIDPAPQSASA